MNRDMLSLMPFAGMLLVLGIVYIQARLHRNQTESRRDVQLALLSKFSSGEEMARFLATEEGRKMIDQIATPSNRDPRYLAASLLIGGCVMASLGVAFTGLTLFAGLDKLVVPAVVNGSLSLGLFAGAFLFRRAAEAMGLISASPKDRG